MNSKVIRIVCMAAALLMASTSFAQFGRTRPRCLCDIPNHNYQFGSRSTSTTAVSRIGLLLEKSKSETRKQINSARPAEPAESLRRATELVRIQETVRRVSGRTTNEPRTGSARPRIQRPLAPLTTADGNGSANRAPFRLFSDRSRLRHFSRPIGTAAQPLRNTVPETIPPPNSTRRVIRLYQLNQPRLEVDHCSVSHVAVQLHSTGDWVLSLRGDQNAKSETSNGQFDPKLSLKRNQFTVRLRCLGSFENPPREGDAVAGKPVLANLKPIIFWVQKGQPQNIRTAGHSQLVKDYFQLIDRIEIEFHYR